MFESDRSVQSNFLQVVKPALLYLFLAFTWSVLGFLTPTTPLHYKEYPFSGLLLEVGGHLGFGALAGAFSMDATLTMICSAEALLIDADHILPALSFPILPRLSHSVFFALVAGTTLAYSSGKGRGLRLQLFLVTISAVISHLSFDVLAGFGQFPILFPFAFQTFSFPDWSWTLLESASIMLNLFLAARLRQSATSARLN